MTRWVPTRVNLCSLSPYYLQKHIEGCYVGNQTQGKEHIEHNRLNSVRGKRSLNVVIERVLTFQDKRLIGDVLYVILHYLTS